MDSRKLLCANSRCEHNDLKWQYSCKAVSAASLGYDISTREMGQYVLACKKFKSPEHAAIIETLKQLSIALKTARQKKIDPKHPFLKASWIGRRYAQKEAIKTLAHNWINRNKRTTPT